MKFKPDQPLNKTNTMPAPIGIPAWIREIPQEPSPQNSYSQLAAVREGNVVFSISPSGHATNTTELFRLN